MIDVGESPKQTVEKKLVMRYKEDRLALMRLCAGITYIMILRCQVMPPHYFISGGGVSCPTPRAIPKRNLPLDDVLIWLLSQP